MKNFERNDLLFSLCGLNCALCTMKLDGYCPGCGGGAGNQGRRKTLFSLAVNLFDLSDMEAAIGKIESEISAESTRKEKAFVAVKHFENTAKQKGVTLKLKKKVSNKK